MERVIVVGAGITGAFVSYFLRRAGTEVTLIDASHRGGRASANNPGGLNPLYGSGIPGPLQRLAMQAFELHLSHRDEIVRLSDSDCSVRRKQRLNLAVDESDASRLSQLQAAYEAMPGFGARRLDRDEVRSLVPDVADYVSSGLLAEGDAKVDAVSYTRAVVSAARELGAEVIDAEVTGLDTEGDRVTGVRVASEKLQCAGVVLATGAWCQGPAEWLGAEIPIAPVKGELLTVEVEKAPNLDLAWREFAAYSGEGNRLVLGGTEDEAGFDPRPTEAGRRSILEGIGTVLPAVSNAPVLDHIAGLRPVSSDGLPIVGRPAGWTNVCLALGSGRKGMLLGAALGLAAAELTTGGGTVMDIEHCHPDRFASGRMTG